MIILCSWPDRPGLWSPPDGSCLQRPCRFSPHLYHISCFDSLSKWCGTMFHCCFLTQGFSSDVAKEHLSVISSSWECTYLMPSHFFLPGVSQAQCSPVPLPALGTQRIIQGNGTTVGTIISLQCPAKHRLVGSEMMCVMDNNSTYWTGKTYCKRKQKQKAITERTAPVCPCICESNCL